MHLVKESLKRNENTINQYRYRGSGKMPCLENHCIEITVFHPNVDMDINAATRALFLRRKVKTKKYFLRRNIQVAEKPRCERGDFALSMGTLHMVFSKLIKLVIRLCFEEDTNVCQGHHNHTAVQREDYSSAEGSGTLVFSF